MSALSPMDEYLRANQRYWDSLVPFHAASAFYDVEGFKAGRITLLPLEREEVGGVEGKTLLHLQCHFGLDTLSWARLGAQVTGVDFSAPAIALAREIQEEVGLEATFLCDDIHRLPQVLQGQFDVVFTSYGVLFWLPDVPRWAEVVAHFVKPGGFFYLVEDHPVALMFENEADTEELEIAHSYFPSRAPLRFEYPGSYAAPQAESSTPSYEWHHSLGEVVTSLIQAGLRLEFLHEFPFAAWQRFPSMERDEAGWWRLKGAEQDFPLTFSVRARKPASG